MTKTRTSLILKSDLNPMVAFKKMSYQELIDTLAYFQDKAKRLPELYFPEIALLNELLTPNKLAA